MQVELESVKKEYANARLERNAADERANILASEVIGLEEKVISFNKNNIYFFVVDYIHSWHVWSLALDTFLFFLEISVHCMIFLGTPTPVK